MKRRDFIQNIITSLPLTLVANKVLADNYNTQNVMTHYLSPEVYLDKCYIAPMNSVRKKLRYVQSYVGYGNFNIISFDEAALVLRNSPTHKRFTQEELDFIEYIFYYQPEVHGFYGERISQTLTTKIDKKETIKIPYTGHYLYKGKPLETYENMTKDIGKTLVLTSGIRSIVKQMRLFLDKLYAVNYSLSEASRSIAPPAFTYHSVGDFDVGKKGLGASNFTARFATTPEFNEMRKLKYIDMRYTINNKDGVRYEPWHVKII